MTDRSEPDADPGRRRSAPEDEYALDDPLGLEDHADPDDEPDDGLVALPDPQGSTDRPAGSSAPPQPPPAAPSPGIEPPPPPPQPSDTGSSDRGFVEYLHAPDVQFSRPRFFRATGRIAGAAALVVLGLSLVGLAWGRTWFTGALVLALGFLVGEASAVILESLRRLEKRLPPPREGNKQ